MAEVSCKESLERRLKRMEIILPEKFYDQTEAGLTLLHERGLLRVLKARSADVYRNRMSPAIFTSCLEGTLASVFVLEHLNDPVAVIGAIVFGTLIILGTLRAGRSWAGSAEENTICQGLEAVGSNLDEFQDMLKNRKIRTGSEPP